MLVQEYLYDWIKNLAVYNLLLCTIIQLSPNEKYTRYLRYFMGIFLISMILAPILSLTGDGLKLIENYQIYMQEAQTQQELLWEQFQKKEESLTEGLEKIYGIYEEVHPYDCEKSGNEAMAGNLFIWDSSDSNCTSY